MKKLQTTIKTMCLVATVFIMAQGCIPNTPIGGNPTLSNTFGIYLSDEGITTSLSKYKLVVVGDDSLYFTFNYIDNTYYPGEDFNIFLQSSTGTTTEYLCNTSYNVFATFPAGLSVSGNMDSTYRWLNSTIVNLQEPYTNFNQQLKTVGYFSLPGSPFLNIPVNPLNENRYYVFRRLKGSQYYYYWIKANCNFGNGPGSFVVTISNGKRQADSIITGQ